MTYSRRVFTSGALACSTVPLVAHDEEGDPILTRVAMIHGGTGPLAVAGYRMGEAALKQLRLNRGNVSVEVIHHSPREVRWSCIIDGLQAATGASVGNLNLQLVESQLGKIYSVVRNRKTGQEVKLTLTPEFIQQNLNLTGNHLLAAGSRTTALPESEIFRISR